VAHRLGAAEQDAVVADRAEQRQQSALTPPSST